MSTPNDGGPAFPRPGVPTNWAEGHLAQAGMSLRDYFAGQALAGLLAAKAQMPEGVNCKNVDYVVALEAYRSADAMLKAREGKQ